MEDKLKINKGIITILGHFGNWEILTFIPKLTGLKINTIAKDIKPKFLNKFLIKLRTRNGMNVISFKNSSLTLFKKLKKNEIIAMIIDQRTRKYGSIKINFAGREIYATKAPAYLYQKTSAPVILCYTKRDENGKFIVEFFDINLTGNIEEDTQIIQDVILKFIKKEPSNWFWLHSKFKSRKSLLRELNNLSRI